MKFICLIQKLTRWNKEWKGIRFEMCFETFCGDRDSSENVTCYLVHKSKHDQRQT
jgi:hypothetical protein